MCSLLPQWLEVVWAAAFACVGVSHLRHMAHSLGQRRAWHACHVLMALGMVFMYLPVNLMPITVPGSFWQLVFAAAGTLAALWALGGTGSIVWLLTALDLGVMLLMWSEGQIAEPLVWLVIAYLMVEAGLWLLDVYRRLDGTHAVLNWQLLSPESDALTVSAAATTAAGSENLLGELDITASMLVMTAGMAYMVVAMMVM